jgi:23S rRNA (cytidine1920-2'-O)/16S rRNA (cytidine1409-2'-O)-methyltransferase
MAYSRIILPPPTSKLAVGGAGDAVPPGRAFVSRAGEKLSAAFEVFGIVVSGQTCADLGANVGGFTDCLLQHGAAKVYAVDTAYGVLAWSLRKDPRVVVRDRTNALYFRPPEPVSVVTVDVGWTRQARILPAVAKALPPDRIGDVLTLIKPHYESDLAKTQRGVLTPEQSEAMLWQVIDQIAEAQDERGPSWQIQGITRSPLEGQKGNVEYIAWLRLTR